MGEDGPEGLSAASRRAIDRAEIIMGPPRHLALLGAVDAQCIAWPVPFADGIPVLKSHRGRRVVVLASGDPFWFGAGSALSRELAPSEWSALPGVSSFSLAAARLGWAIDGVICRGCHATPFERLTPDLAPGVRLIVTLRDGAAVARLAEFLCGLGFAASGLTVMEALGGPRERVRQATAETFDLDDVAHPVVVAVEVAGGVGVVHKAGGQMDELFDHDGQITKRPIRALTLSALAPRPGERLWDIGAGSGSVGLEWLMADATTEAVAIEADATRAARIIENARRLGQDRMQVVEGTAPIALAGLPKPDAVFVGGGLTRDLLDWLFKNAPTSTRLVVNAVTLETESLVVDAAGRKGGSLMKIETSDAAPLGRFRGWKASYPIAQWSVTL